MGGYFGHDDDLARMEHASNPDALDALINGDKGQVRTRPDRDTTTSFIEKCPNCRGSGRFYSYTGRLVGECFKCKGVGTQSFKTSPEERQKQRQDQAARRDETKSAWADEHFDVLMWCGKHEAKSAFAASLLDSYARYKRLTENQVAAVRRSIARDAQKEAEETARAKEEALKEKPEIEVEGLARLKASFDKAVEFAREKGLTMRSPRIVVNGMKISLAKPESTNPGAIYVKLGEQYLGKIVGNRFHAARECSDAQIAQVQAFIADPQQAAKAYGQTTGVCCVCNATLKSKWKEKGIGPICAKKYGWD